MAVQLSKTPKVRLTKGAKVSLTKDGESSSEKLHKVYFGANWGSIKEYREVKTRKGGFLGIFGGEEVIEKKVVGSEAVDLDASILLYDENYNNFDVVYFGHKVSNCGAISHSGDDLTGDEGYPDEDDNEVISIDLDKINPRAKYLVAILNSYKHQTFDEIPYAGLRIFTGKNPNKVDEVLAAYKLEGVPEFKGKEAIVLGYFYKTKSGWWDFKADGTTSKEKSIGSISRGSALSVIKNHRE